MSIKIMSHVWENGPSGTAERFVLLALADYANDTGECWPSISGVCRKTCMTDRGVQRIIRRLEACGWLSVDVGNGRTNCNVYHIKTPTVGHPDRGSPPTLKTETPTLKTENPDRGSPEPSLTIKKPSTCSFDEFWAVWPNKNDKQKAMGAWKKLKPDERVAARDRAVAWFSAWRAANPDLSTIHPTTYLNGKRWADEAASGPVFSQQALKYQKMGR